MKSIIEKNGIECYICGSMRNLENHHCIHGNKRKLADREGLTVHLCRNCHRRLHDFGEHDMELKVIAQESMDAAQPCNRRRIPPAVRKELHLTRQKYNAHKTTVDGITFASKKEASRYEVLKVLEKSGVISDLKCQVPYPLIPAQTEEPVWVPYKRPIKGQKGRWKPGKTIERACVYVADFTYTQDGHTVVEDVKGRRTKEYVLKRKLMLKEYGIRIKET